MCQGSGKISLQQPHLKGKVMESKQLAAKTLQQQGYSIREIMKALNYKSPRSVQNLLQEKNFGK